MNGPEKPEPIIKLRLIAKNTSPIMPTQTQPVDARGLKIFFEVMICFVSPWLLFATLVSKTFRSYCSLATFLFLYSQGQPRR